MIHAVYVFFILCMLLMSFTVGELLFFISSTMLDGGPCGFGMQLSTLGVLNKDFVSC